MTDRIKRMWDSTLTENYPVCIDKFKIMLETINETTELPQATRRAKCLANVLDKIPIFIREDELIVGGGASRPGGVEIDVEYSIWDKDEIDGLRNDGFIITKEDEEELLELNKSFKVRTYIEAQRELVENHEYLFAFLRAGMILPPWKAEGGPGGGFAQSGYGLGPGFHLMSIDYSIPMTRGVNVLIDECRDHLSKLAFEDPLSAERAITYRAMITALEAFVRFGKRFSKLAKEMAEKETRPQRKAELLSIAEICDRVPGEPPRNFREAMQMFWFLFLMVNPSPTACMARFDQYMYPFYKKDKEAGLITDDEVLEYLEMIRIKDMELNRISGKEARKKNAGYAKWHNMTIGGVKPDGTDASNELSYLILDAVMDCPLPHHTVSLRISEVTPRSLILKGLECVKRGLTMPAFLSDASYIKFFTDRGMPIEIARNYCPTGCLDANVPGHSRTVGCTMFVMPMTLNLFFNDGVDKRTGMRVGPPTGDVLSYKTYEEFETAYKKNLYHYMKLNAWNNNMRGLLQRQLFTYPLRSAFFHGCIEQGLDLSTIRFPFENAQVMNPVGLINVGNALYAIKKLVFEDKVTTLKELKTAMDANWAGYEDLRKKCLEVPKYGNNIDDVDLIVADLYRYWEEVSYSLPAAYGGSQTCTGISVTSHYPAGELSRATPDGRYDKEMLADGSMSPVQGQDTNGPTAMLLSAMKINQDHFQATLLNMKIHPSSLKTNADLEKLCDLMLTYFKNGGKHIQYNVVDASTLREAQEQPVKHKNLMVRIAGYSAYFVNLNSKMQGDIIRRTENML